MAKKSAVEKNKNREVLVQKNADKRSVLKKVIMDRKVSAEERFQASLKLAKLPRNGAKIRLRNRCSLSGRPRGYYRKLGLSRIAFRELTSQGKIPGMIKSSW
jgi:small subunit ribosomal protein S14